MDTVKVGPLGRPGMPYDGPWMVHLRGSSATSASRMPCQVYSCSRDNNCHACNWPGRGPGRELQQLGLLTSFRRGTTTHRGTQHAAQRGRPSAQAPISSQFANRNCRVNRAVKIQTTFGISAAGTPAGRGRGAFWGLLAVSRPRSGQLAHCANSIVKNRRALHRLMPGFFLHHFVVHKLVFFCLPQLFRAARPWLRRGNGGAHSRV